MALRANSGTSRSWGGGWSEDARRGAGLQDDPSAGREGSKGEQVVRRRFISSLDVRVGGACHRVREVLKVIGKVLRPKTGGKELSKVFRIVGVHCVVVCAEKSEQVQLKTELSSFWRTWLDEIVQKIRARSILHHFFQNCCTNWPLNMATTCRKREVHSYKIDGLAFNILLLHDL